MTMRRSNAAMCWFIAAGMAYLFGHVIVAELPKGAALMVGLVIVAAVALAVATRKGWIE